MQAPPLAPDADWKQLYAALLDADAAHGASDTVEASRELGGRLRKQRVPLAELGRAHIAALAKATADAALSVRHLSDATTIFAALLAGYAAEPPPACELATPGPAQAAEAPSAAHEYWRTDAGSARALLDAIPDMLFRMDANGRLLDYKPAPGYRPIVPPAEFLGRNVADVLPADVAATMVRAAQDACRSGAVQVFDYRLHAHGRMGYFEGRIARCAPGEVLLIVRNVTASRDVAEALRDSEQRFRRLFENAAMAVVLTDLAGRLHDVNDACCRFFGQPRAALLDHHFREFTHPDDVAQDERLYAQLAAGQRESYELDKRFLRADGQVIWGHLHVSLVRDADQRPLYAVVICDDITARQQAEAALRETQALYRDELEKLVQARTAELARVNAQLERELRERRQTEAVLRRSEDQLRLIADNVSGMICYIGADQRFRFVNRRYAEWCRLPTHEIVGRTLAEIVGPAIDAMLQPQIAKVLAGEEVRFERLIERHGRARWVSVAYVPERSPDGTVTAFYGLINEVTERKEAEAALRESEERFRQLAENIREVFWLIEPGDGRTLYISPAYEQVAGQPRSSIYTERQGWLKLVHPADRAGIVADRERQARGEATEREFRILHADGSERWISMRAFPILDARGQVYRVAGIAEDITARKQAQDFLHIQRDLGVALSSASELREALDFVLDAACRISGMECAGIYVTDEASGEADLVTSRGLSQEFIAAVAHVPRDSPPAAVLAAGQPLYARGDHSSLAGDAFTREGLRATCIIPVLNHGRPVGCLNLASRVCEEASPHVRAALEAIASRIGGVIARVRATQALRESEARNRAIVAAIPDLIFRQHRDGTFLDFHSPNDDLMAVPAADVIGHSLRNMPLPADFVAQQMAALERTLATGSLQSAEYRLAVPRGMRDFEARLVPCGPDEILCVVRDITDRKQAEENARRHQEQIAHVSRVATLGEMVSGLAHELAQPLSAMLYYARSSAARLRAGDWGIDAAADAIEKIALQAERAGEFILRLKAFVRKTPPYRVRCALNPVVQEALAFAAPELRARQVAVRAVLAPGLPPVVIDVIQIQQVILNLVRNAADALERTPAAARLVEIATTVHDGAVELTLRDNGCGVAPGIADRIFDPFVTTKPAGTGLGLSISRSLVEAHEGRLWMRTAPQRGSIFGFTLPAAREDDDGGSGPDGLRGG